MLLIDKSLGDKGRGRRRRIRADADSASSGGRDTFSQARGVARPRASHEGNGIVTISATSARIFSRGTRRRRGSEGRGALVSACSVESPLAMARNRCIYVGDSCQRYLACTFLRLKDPKDEVNDSILVDGVTNCSTDRCGAFAPHREKKAFERRRRIARGAGRRREYRSISITLGRRSRCATREEISRGKKSEMPLGDISEIRKRRNSIFDLASWLGNGFVPPGSVPPMKLRRTRRRDKRKRREVGAWSRRRAPWSPRRFTNGHRR